MKSNEDGIFFLITQDLDPWGWRVHVNIPVITCCDNLRSMERHATIQPLTHDLNEIIIKRIMLIRYYLMLW